jgi:hypothetical protein
MSPRAVRKFEIKTMTKAKSALPMQLNILARAVEQLQKAIGDLVLADALIADEQ